MSTDDASQVLLDRFTTPRPEFGPLPIWWWSGARVTAERLREQMSRMVSQGIRQAVVMCLAPTGPLFGSLADDPPFMSEPWWRLLDGACADAAELGFRIWLYDQIGFSGANLQGRLIAREPAFVGQALHRTVVRTGGDPVHLRPPAGHVVLAAFAGDGPDEAVSIPVTPAGAEWAGGAATVTLVHSGPRGFDYFGRQACATLLDTVHGEYERRVGRWFGRSIGGFFQDELPTMPTWGRDFAASFAQNHGYDLVPNLLALWEGDTADAARIRRDYQEHRARSARRGFFDQHDAWFAERGLICGFDQSTPAREGDPVGGVRVYGDYLGTHSGYGAPGSDHWGDSKVHSSLAHAHGRPRTWIEAFHSSGWGGTLEETYDWLSPFLRRGANLYDPHAVYYSTAGGWWEWAPPSTCWRQPYWPSYHVFADAVARLCSTLTVGDHVCDVVLLSPTTTSQAHLTLDGAQRPAATAAATYHALNGVASWWRERRGVLESAGIDHDVLDETTLAGGTVVDGALVVGREVYRTVVLPAASALHVSAAVKLVELARAGGAVVCVGTAPTLFLGDGPVPGDEAESLFGDAVAEGLIRLVDTPEDVPPAVVAGPVRITADAPVLVRRHGGVHVLTLVAHDDRTGTAAPITTLGGEGWETSGFRWEEYWHQLHEDGYRFTGVGDRSAVVRVSGRPPARAQQWSPRTGERVDLDVTVEPDGTWAFTAGFDGAVALVVVGDDLPPATREPLGAVVGTTELPGPWRALARSTLDNSAGDLAAADRTGVLPIEVWRFEHAVGEQPVDWSPVVAGFGQFAEVAGPHPAGGEARWRPAEWSLSRGIAGDPAHLEPLGPKGYVPEDFLDWRPVQAGGQVAVRTWLTVPDRPGLVLVVGATAARRVVVDDVELPADGDGRYSSSPLPDGVRGRTVRLLVELTAERDGPVRASFAVVADPDRYRRPEWLSPAGGGVTGQSGELTRRFTLDAVPADAVVQVASDGPCAVLVNGSEIARQGDFNPYPGLRETRVHPYDVGALLRVGENVITLRVTDPAPQPTAAFLDSTPVADGGLGLVTGPGWEATREGAAVAVAPRRDLLTEPRYLCLRARPHPLPGAGWLEPAAAATGVVEPVVPDVAPGAERTEWLRMPAPAGTTALVIPTALPVVVVVGDREHPVRDGRVRLPAPLQAGTPVLLRVRAGDGRRGGALLDMAVRVEVAETEVPLVSWERLGLRALGGEVAYRTSVEVTDLDHAAVLDLGEVRGTADVVVNGALVDRLVWGPWRSDVTDALRPGVNEVEVVVRGTLAGYLDDASPTAAVVAGQVRTGLFGPVVLRRHERTQV